MDMGYLRWTLVLGLLGTGTVLMAQPMRFRGADVSSLPEVTDQGGQFKTANGQSIHLMDMIKASGGTTVRLKLWNNPANGYNNLARVVSMAKEAKARDLKILLDFHYSDTWADPGNQQIPAAWQGMDFRQLKAAVQTFSRESVEALVAAGAAPDIVQIGNEISNGMLWPHGQLYGGANSFEQFTELLKAGISGTKQAHPTAQIMLHIDKGGDNGGSVWFYDKMTTYGVPYDLIGLSYYPWWHGSLSAFQNNVNDLAGRYNKDLVLVETAYPWTMDMTGRPWPHVKGDTSGLIDGMPATPEGQSAFLASVRSIVENAPNGRGAGVLYWEPGWLTTGTLQSPWDNLNLVDYSGRELPGMRVLMVPEPSFVMVGIAASALGAVIRRKKSR